jgi:hypothetical protein
MLKSLATYADIRLVLLSFLGCPMRLVVGAKESLNTPSEIDQVTHVLFLTDAASCPSRTGLLAIARPQLTKFIVSFSDLLDALSECFLRVIAEIPLPFAAFNWPMQIDVQRVRFGTPRTQTTQSWELSVDRGQQKPSFIRSFCDLPATGGHCRDLV